MLKKIFFIFIFTFFALASGFISTARADLLSTEICRVQEPRSDDASNIFSLRSALVSYNRSATNPQRACTQKILFETAGSFNINLLSPLRFSGTGPLHIDGSEARQVILDATHLSDGQCAIDVSTKLESEKVKISAVIIKVRNYNQAICGRAFESDPQHPFIIQVMDQNYTQQCLAGSACCNEQGEFLRSSSSCNTESNAAGFCSSAGRCLPLSIIFPANGLVLNLEVVQCEPNTQCCDSHGRFLSQGAACTLSGNAGLCSNAGNCIVTAQMPPTPPTPPTDPRMGQNESAAASSGCVLHQNQKALHFSWLHLLIGISFLFFYSLKIKKYFK